MRSKAVPGVGCDGDVGQTEAANAPGAPGTGTGTRAQAAGKLERVRIFAGARRRRRRGRRSCGCGRGRGGRGCERRGREVEAEGVGARRELGALRGTAGLEGQRRELQLAQQVPRVRVVHQEDLPLHVDRRRKHVQRQVGQHQRHRHGDAARGHRGRQRGGGRGGGGGGCRRRRRGRCISQAAAAAAGVTAAAVSTAARGAAARKGRRVRLQQVRLFLVVRRRGCPSAASSSARASACGCARARAGADGGEGVERVGRDDEHVLAVRVLGVHVRQTRLQTPDTNRKTKRGELDKKASPGLRFWSRVGPGECS